jgi:hypothetical protein
MPCIFCGNARVTSEHVFPRWLSRFLLSDELQQLEQARHGAGGFDSQLTSVGPDVTVRRVCAACKKGWMAQLEADSIPVLERLIGGLELQPVSPSDQRQIALWATKTAMMIDQAQDGPLIPGQQLSRLRTHRAIPGGTRMWMGACKTLAPIVTSHTIKIELETIDDATAPRPQGFYAPMKLGHLCLYVYFPASDVVVVPPSLYRPSLARIWPRRGEIAWPPPARPSDGTAFEDFADRFWRDWVILTPESARQQGAKEW